MWDLKDKSVEKVEEFKQNLRSLGFREWDVVLGKNIATASQEFLEFLSKNPGRDCFVEMNGCIFSSLDKDLTVESMVKFVTGSTIEELEQARKEWLEKIHKEEEERKLQMPQLTKEYIEKGHSILKREFWEKWDECVPIRLEDLYHGMELDCTLELIQLIQSGEDFQKVEEAFDAQGHSGMSYSLVRSMVGIFGGSEFVLWLKEKAEKQKEVSVVR